MFFDLWHCTKQRQTSRVLGFVRTVQKHQKIKHDPEGLCMIVILLYATIFLPLFDENNQVQKTVIC